MHLKEWGYLRKPAPSVVKRGRVAQTKKDKAPNKRQRKEKTRYLQKTVNMSHLGSIDTLWIFHNLALKRAIEMRMLAHQKTLMPSYWGIMRHQRGYKKFSSSMLVSEKCMIVVLQLSTHVSQSSLMRIS
jgi:hypothetical protein